MKKVVLLFLAVGSLVAFVLLGVEMINTNSTDKIGWMIIALVVSLGSTILLNVFDKRGKGQR